MPCNVDDNDDIFAQKEQSMSKKIMTIFAAVFLLQQLGCSPATDKYQLRVNFLPGEYTLKILNKTHIKKDDVTYSVSFGEESWSMIIHPRESPDNILLELKNRVSTHQRELFEVSYDSNRPTNSEIFYATEPHEHVCKEGLVSRLSTFAGPKTGTKLKASLLNGFREIGDIKIIEQGNPDDSFKDMYFEGTFSIINNIHALLPERKVKVGDSWQRSLIRPLVFQPEIHRSSRAIIAVVTLEKIEKRDIDDAEFAILKVVIDSRTDRLPFGGPLPVTVEDVVISSEGIIVLNISNGIPVSYTAKTEMHYMLFGEFRYEIQEEFKYEFIFTPDVPDLP
jgi:hypothetical protein